MYGSCYTSFSHIKTSYRSRFLLKRKQMKDLFVKMFEKQNNFMFDFMIIDIMQLSLTCRNEDLLIDLK